MRIGVVSDSHNHLDNLHLAVRKLIEEERVKIIIHLGDDYDDVQAIKNPGIELLKVPGVFSCYYYDPRTPNRLIKKFSPWKFLLTHAPTTYENDLPTDRDPEDIIAEEKINIVLHGHTHIPRIEEKDNVLWLNPGHLKTRDTRGHPSSYALVTLEENQLKAKIIDLIKSKEIFAKTFKQGIKW